MSGASSGSLEKLGERLCNQIVEARGQHAVRVGVLAEEVDVIALLLDAVRKLLATLRNQPLQIVDPPLARSRDNGSRRLGFLQRLPRCRCDGRRLGFRRPVLLSPLDLVGALDYFGFTRLELTLARGQLGRLPRRRLLARCDLSYSLFEIVRAGIQRTFALVERAIASVVRRARLTERTAKYDGERRQQ